MIAGVDRDYNIDVYLHSTSIETEREIRKLKELRKIVGPIIKTSEPRLEFLELILDNDKPSNGVIAEYNGGLYRVYLSGNCYDDVDRRGYVEILIDTVEHGNDGCMDVECSRIRIVSIYDDARMKFGRKLHRNYLELCRKEIYEEGRSGEQKRGKRVFLGFPTEIR